jgi:hypothetical protein
MPAGRSWGQMDGDCAALERLRWPMKVRDLLARLKDTDPDFLVVIGSQSLMIVNPRPGFCLREELENDESSCLTEQDEEFLRSLRIKQ